MESLINNKSQLIRVPEIFASNLDEWVIKKSEEKNTKLNRQDALKIINESLPSIDFDINRKPKTKERMILIRLR
jgi:hypothetical protein